MATRSLTTPESADATHYVERRKRRALFGVAAVVSVVVGLVPPVSHEARRYIFAGGLQFALFGFVAPALIVLWAPWRVLDRGGRLARAAESRRRGASYPRAIGWLVVSQAMMIFWRTPAAVNALVRHAWVAPVECFALVAVGTAFWLELVDSAPFTPRVPRQRRIILATFAMWIAWITAYLVGLSHSTSYGAYASVVGRGLSVAADQQVMAGLLWAIAALVYLPIVFANLMAWLRDEQNPDEELRRITREERRRARWYPDGIPGGNGSH